MAIIYLADGKEKDLEVTGEETRKIYRLRVEVIEKHSLHIQELFKKYKSPEEFPVTRKFLHPFVEYGDVDPEGLGYIQSSTYIKTDENGYHILSLSQRLSDCVGSLELMNALMNKTNEPINLMPMDADFSYARDKELLSKIWECLDVKFEDYRSVQKLKVLRAALTFDDHLSKLERLLNEDINKWESQIPTATKNLNILRLAKVPLPDFID